MIIGIDASNIRAGGGLTHLVELLKAAEPLKHDFSKIIIWSRSVTLSKIEDRPWIEKKKQKHLEKGLFNRIFWQRFRLSKQARLLNCDVLFIPGGSYAGDFYPIVTMNQNLLPFEWNELKRFGYSLFTLKMILLRWIQKKTLINAEGVIFLTHYAKDIVIGVIKSINGKMMIIPHGIDDRFKNPPREQLSAKKYTIDNPFRILYVSVIYPYKHQWHVVDAIAQLRKNGVPITLNLVGPSSSYSLERLQKKIKKVDPFKEFVQYSGAVHYKELNKYYENANVFLFASSCETFGMILTEAMLAGLPIACSDRSAMPELLGNTGVYFDPEQPNKISEAISKLFNDHELRFKLANESFKKVQGYSWKRCANETFSLIKQVVSKT
ncbi:MAG: glycosyltransferase family 4 protein [Desulfobacterales bacterium]|nr:glycosyltransferase family 4 protein [Desulfobacterales bacterium]